ncbi:MAG: hypothetical protein HYW85_01705, partial [Deltaproteobacteria bacterium]|nr:hypothetical protein [Deltaproteobacteria bacterium]
MKKCIVIGFLLIFSHVHAGGGSDASGGGNYLETKIRMGKALAILALTTMSDQELDGFDLNHAQFEFYSRTRISLAQDLSSSPLIFRPVLMRHLFLLDDEGNSILIKVDTEEKTAKTKHMPHFPIEINLARCEELRMTEQGAAILLMRESAINKFLLKNSSLLLENFEALKSLDKPFVRSIPYSSVQSNQGEMTYISEEMLHYYIADFNTEEAELILATFKKIEEFLEGLSFPVHFEFRGALPKEIYDEHYSSTKRYVRNHVYRKDGANVIFRSDFNSSFAYDDVKQEDEIGIWQTNINGIWTNFDVLINSDITSSPHSRRFKSWDESSETYRPCLCTVIFKSMFRGLSLNKVFPWVEQPTPKPTQPHVHFDFLDQFSASQIQALRDYLMTRVVFVQKPKMTLRIDDSDLSLYETEGGILIKFKPSLLKLIRDDMCIGVYRKSSFFWVDG